MIQNSGGTLSATNKLSGRDPHKILPGGEITIADLRVDRYRPGRNSFREEQDFSLLGKLTPKTFALHCLLSEIRDPNFDIIKVADIIHGNPELRGVVRSSCSQEKLEQLRYAYVAYKCELMAEVSAG